MYYYVYLIKFNTGQFYIGSRQSKVTSEDDTKYWGSPKTYKHLWKDTNLEKTKHIIKICSTFDEMRNLEVKLIKEAWEKYPDLCVNRTATPVFHPEIIESLIEKRSKDFILKSPEGKIVTGKNITKFCKENNLNVANIHSVVNGLNKSCKGWKLPETMLFGSEIKQKDFILKSPEGKIVTGKNITKFCKENNLHIGSISLVLNGKRKSHKGWCLPETIRMGVDAFSFSKSKNFILKSPCGDIIQGKNIKKFCKDNQLNSSCIHAVLSGKRTHHKGWTLP